MSSKEEAVAALKGVVAKKITVDDLQEKLSVAMSELQNAEVAILQSAANGGSFISIGSSYAVDDHSVYVGTGNSTLFVAIAKLLPID
jgi:hypothetical protein